MVKLKNRKVALVTGSAGFIGFHISKILLENDWKVIGVDCLSDYYDITLKIEKLYSKASVVSFGKEKIETLDYYPKSSRKKT